MQESGETTDVNEMWWLNQLKWGSGRQHSNHLWDCGSFHNHFLCDAIFYVLTIDISNHILIFQDTRACFCGAIQHLIICSLATFCDSGFFTLDVTLLAVCLRGRFTADAVSRLQRSWPTNMAVFFRGLITIDNWKKLRFGRVKRGYFGIVGWGGAIYTCYE